jgi:hypothetical protein
MRPESTQGLTEDVEDKAHATLYRLGFWRSLGEAGPWTLDFRPWASYLGYKASPWASGVGPWTSASRAQRIEGLADLRPVVVGA